MFSDKYYAKHGSQNGDISSHLPMPSAQAASAKKPSVAQSQGMSYMGGRSTTTASTTTGLTSNNKSSSKATTTSTASLKLAARPQSAATRLKPPRNDNTVYFATVNDNGQVNLKTAGEMTDKSERKRLRAEKRKFSVGGGATYERKLTQPGRYMQQAKEAAIRRRHKLVARQGELLEKEHLYDCQLASKI